VIKNIRQQLTLFVAEDDAKEIEAIRKRYNLLQSELINSHVTLCREDEIKNIDKVLENLNILDQKEISIHFGQVIRFNNDKGVLMSATNETHQFHLLREKILKGVEANIRQHEPHITLMHPRNSTCTDRIFDIIKKANLPTRLNFDTISLIEQVDGGQWRTILKFNLKPI